MRTLAVIFLAIACSICSRAQSSDKKLTDAKMSESMSDLDSEISAINNASTPPSLFFAPSGTSGGLVNISEDHTAAPSTLETIAPSRLLIVYRSGVIPANADALTRGVQAHVIITYHSLVCPASR